eukprot:5307656-Pleurochrysis_carterae.AAC.7
MMLRQGAIGRACGPPVRACFDVNVAYWIIVVCRDARARPARKYCRRARQLKLVLEPGSAVAPATSHCPNTYDGN